jgi:hypothetical protein
LKGLFDSDKEVSHTYSLREYEKKLIEFLRPFFDSKSLVDHNKLSEFVAGLKSAPLQAFAVLREIHGLRLDDNTKPCTRGPFTIYNFATHEALLNAKAAVNPEAIWLGHTPVYLIETTTHAREEQKAMELADRRFEQFEMMMRFFLGFQRDRFEVGVLNYHGLQGRQAYVFTEAGGYAASMTRHGPIDTVPIDDPYFVDADMGFDRIWGLLSTSKTEVERRLLLAAEWIGQAYSDLSAPSAFLKAAIALEILFTVQEKTIINASILSQISESVALLLGSTKEDRLKIEAELKRLYGMRSAIAHAGKANVPQEDLLSMLAIPREVVIKLVTSTALRECKSISEIHLHLKGLKYSFSPLT